MAKKKGNDYFEMFTEAAGCSYDAAIMLREIFKNFATSEKKIEEIHDIEHKGDEIYHNLVTSLCAEFITPIERNDIMQLANIIDDLTDAVENIPCRMQMFCIQNMRSEAFEFAELIVKAVETIISALKEMKNFKKSKEIHNYIVQINHYEEEGDRLYHKAIHALFSEKNPDPVDLMRWREAFSYMEKCLDICEEVADTIEAVMLNNS